MGPDRILLTVDSDKATSIARMTKKVQLWEKVLLIGGSPMIVKSTVVIWLIATEDIEKTK